VSLAYTRKHDADPPRRVAIRPWLPLARWSSTWLERLPGPEAELTDLTPSEIALCAASYADLRDRRASIKQMSTGQVSVGFGPTGAAKTLFAIRPRVFAPWDIPIRKARRWSGDAASFQAYLTDMADQLQMLSAEAGVPVSALPALVGRPNASPPQAHRRVQLDDPDPGLDPTVCQSVAPGTSGATR
jgi:hypothetical protein